MEEFVSLYTQYYLLIGLPLLFMLIVAWIYRPGAKKSYQADGNLPFYGDKKAARVRTGGH